MTKEQYQEYLKSEWWKEKASVMRQLRYAHPKCEICGMGEVQIDVHHINYKNIGNEYPEDLVVLCHKCHTEVHEKGLKIKIIQSGATLYYYHMLYQFLAGGYDRYYAIQRAREEVEESGMVLLHSVKSVWEVVEKTLNDRSENPEYIIIYR